MRLLQRPERHFLHEVVPIGQTESRSADQLAGLVPDERADVMGKDLGFTTWGGRCARGVLPAVWPSLNGPYYFDGFGTRRRMGSDRSEGSLSHTGSRFIVAGHSALGTRQRRDSNVETWRLCASLRPAIANR